MATRKSTPSGAERAIAYVRKSTKGEFTDQHGNRRERQEKSIGAQNRDIESLAELHDYKIVDWLSDEGVSGWKRGKKRPGFYQLLKRAEEKHDFSVVIVDDIDRFSRAEVMEVFGDLSALNAAGVHTIHACNQGVYHLGKNDIGAIIKMTVDIHGSNDFSRKLGRRLARSIRDNAAAGKRSGGAAPYGLALDGKGGLVIGEPAHAKVVQWIYREFVTNLRSMNWLAADLNRRKVPAAQGGIWRTQRIKDILEHPAYKGSFRWLWKKSGRFYFIDENQDVREASERDPNWKYFEGRPEGAVIIDGKYKALIPPAMWNKAQKRIASFSMRGTRHPRENGFPLTGTLICDHCGGKMYGFMDRGKPAYKCSSPGNTGTCRQYQIHQDAILPHILQALAEELDDATIENIRYKLPEAVAAPWTTRETATADQQVAAATLRQRIERAEENLMASDDARTRQSLDRRISAMRDELDALESNLQKTTTADVPAGHFTPEEFETFLSAYREKLAKGIGIPWKPKANPKLPRGFRVAIESMEKIEIVDPKALRELLFEMGAEVRLRWREKKATGPGTGRGRHELQRARFRLGQQSGTFAKVHPSPLAECDETLQFAKQAFCRVDRVIDGRSVSCGGRVLCC